MPRKSDDLGHQGFVGRVKTDEVDAEVQRHQGSLDNAGLLKGMEPFSGEDDGQDAHHERGDEEKKP